MINRIVTGVLMSLLVAATAVGVNAVPASAADDLVKLQANVDAWQVTLHDGRTSGDQYGFLTIKKMVGQNLTNAAFTVLSSSGHYVSGATEYQIVMLGKPTGYWVKAHMFVDRRFEATCGVYSGAPSAGGRLADPSPFTCSATTPHLTHGVAQSTFRIGLNRDAEASGAISPTGNLSLHEGVYATYDLPYAQHGAASVAIGGETTFDTVLRVGDKNPYENQARTEFAYQIYDNGVPTDYWAAGVSTNYRGAFFHGDGHCGIYEGNPLADLGELDQSAPLKSTPYTCTADGSYKSGPRETGHGHYFTRFAVRAR